MFSKKSRPLIGKITGSIVSGFRPGFMDAAMMSPKSPLEHNIQSPRGLNCYEVGGVGLGIVTALGKTGEEGGDIQSVKALYGWNSSRSEPIPMISAKDSASLGGGLEETKINDLEDYTYVTSYGPNKKSFTRVYCDRGEYGINGLERKSAKSHRFTEFEISTARFGDFVALPTTDFLSSCHMCQKNLHGRDIFMYRGEKAFCSTECRSRQIVMDERKEKCSSEASRSAEVSSSSCSNGQVFSTGILAS